jgi:hypothetical protein
MARDAGAPIGTSFGLGAAEGLLGGADWIASLRSGAIGRGCGTEGGAENGAAACTGGAGAGEGAAGCVVCAVTIFGVTACEAVRCSAG